MDEKMMKDKDRIIKLLGARRYNPQKSNLNLELSFNYGEHQTIESKDTALCMYDYAKEILELMENSEEKLDG